MASDSLHIFKNVSSSNHLFTIADSAFKLQDYNALFIAKKHNPHSLDLNDYIALFLVANEWFEAVIKGAFLKTICLFLNLNLSGIM